MCCVRSCSHIGMSTLMITVRCSSFNTVQLSLLTSRSRPPSPSSSRPIDVPQSPQADHRNHSISLPQPRSAMSLPSLNLFSSSLAFPPLVERSRAFRRHSSNILTSSGDVSSDTEDPSDSEDDDDDDDEYSVVAFWGGESPRLGSQSPPERIREETALESDDESEDDVDDSDDEDDEQNGDAGNEDESAEDSRGVLDQLEIFGHR